MKLSAEMEFVLNLTNRCNLKCEMCTQYGDNYKENAQDEMTLIEWADFLYSISDVTPKPHLILMGGEPLLYKEFSELFELIQELGFKAHIITNGYFLDKYIDIIAKSDATITVSLDGLEKTHDKIRNKTGICKKAIENIKKLQELKVNGSNISLKINSVILPDNVDEMVNFIESIQEFELKNFTIQHLQFSSKILNETTQKEFFKRTSQEFSEGFTPKKPYEITPSYINKIITTKDKLKRNWKVPGFIFPALSDDELFDYYLENNLMEMRTGRICTMPWLSPAIGPEGNVYACMSESIGNIKKENFWDIWNNEKINILRKTLVEKGKFEFCAKCCNFYKGNFIASCDQKLRLKDKTVVLPDVINFVQSSTDGVFILDKSRKQIGNEIPVIPVDVHSKKMFDEINKKETIIGYFDELKENKNENCSEFCY